MYNSVIFISHFHFDWEIWGLSILSEERYSDSTSDTLAIWENYDKGIVGNFPFGLSLG